MLFDRSSRPGGLTLTRTEGGGRGRATGRRHVQEMKKHRDVFLSMSHSKHAARESFGCEKTRKPVLAVLCVRRRRDGPDDAAHGDAKPQYFRGVNLEVSMPTGRCAASETRLETRSPPDPALRRKDLFGIAVLSLGKDDVGATSGGGAGGGAMSRESSFVNLAQLAAGNGGDDLSLCRAVGEGGGGRGDLNPLKPCGACKEWLLKIAEVNPGFKVLMFSDVNVSQC